MKDAQAMVYEFHRKFGFARGMLLNPIRDPLSWLDVGMQRDRLISEEHLELKAAWHKRDVLGIADGLGDLAYVVLGTAVAAGIDLAPILEEIHTSNMSKDVGQFKPIKGPGYRPPELRSLLIAQGFSIKEL
jgi:predicted HAD superfamily Cof-like phosphohydrolase